MESEYLDPLDSGVAVRRLNHVPIYLLVAVFCIIIAVVFWAANNKNKETAQAPDDHGTSADGQAQLAAGDRHGYVPAEATPTPYVAPTPMPTATPVSTPNEAEKKARVAAFYTALGSRPFVADPIITQSDQAKSENIRMNNIDAPVPAGIPDLGNPNSLSNYAGAKDRWKTNTFLEKPVTPYIIRTGWVIPCILLSAMESELPGFITAQVAQDVYDTPTGRHLLIPKGSKTIGEYSSAIAYGQSRIFIAWERIIYPDGSALDIGAMPGVDGQGESGFHDTVDNHYLRVFGSALLMSAITGGIALSQPNYQNQSAPNASSTLSSALGQSLGQATSQLLEKNLSIPPTLKIRQGYRFNITCVKDLTFAKPYVVPNYTRNSKP